MKTLVSLVLALVMCLTLAACGKTDTPDDTQNVQAPDVTKTDVPDASADTDDTQEGIQVDKGLFDVEVTLPKTFFQTMTAEEIQASSEESGFKKCVINDDGSVTYTMSKETHAEVLQNLKTSLEQGVSSLLEGEEAVASFDAIDYTDDFSKFDIYVNDAYTEWDTLYALAFYVTGAYYQGFNGVAADDIDVAINFIDNHTKEVLNTSTYKEYMSSLSEA